MRMSRLRGKRSDLKYLALYRAIEGQQTWNEAALKESFTFANFSEAKQHLTALLMRSLTIYDVHPESLMNNRLTEIRILLERSMYHFAMKKIKAARTIALKEERYEALRALADMELVALPFVAPVSSLQTQRATVVAQRKGIFQELETLRKLKDLHDRDLNAVLDKSSQSGHFGPELVAEIEQNPTLRMSDRELPVRAQSIKHRIWNVIRMQQLDFAGRAEVLNKTIELFEAQPFLIAEETVRYIFSLGGYGMCLNVIGKYEESLAATLKLRNIKAPHDNVARSIFLNFATNISTYTLLRGDVTALREHMSYLLSALRAHASSTPAGTLAYIRYLFAIVFWMAGDLRRALKFARQVVEAPAGRTNLQAACKTFMLIFSWEQGDMEAITSYLRAWRRQWRKKAPKFEIERMFAERMGKLINAVGKEEVRTGMEAAAEELQAYLSKGVQVRSDNFIFVQHWLDSKLSGRGLVETVRLQAANK